MNEEIIEEILQDRRKEQIIHWLEEFTKLSNKFFDDNEYKYHEYWKGQVMGIIKVVQLYSIDIDTKYYLSKLI